MFLIGVPIKILKLGLFLVLCGFSKASWGLDRQLSSKEVSSLEAKIIGQPQNTRARRFLFNHYYAKKYWNHADRVLGNFYSKLTITELTNYVHVLFEQKQTDRGLAVIRFLNEKQPPTGRSKYLEGMLLKQKAEIQTANKDEQNKYITNSISAFKKSIQLNPKSENSYLGWIGLIEKFVENPETEALAVYGQLQKTTGDKPKYKNHQCRLFFNAGYLEQAKKACLVAIKNFPKNVNNYIFISRTFKDMSEDQDSKKYALIAIDKFPNSPKAQLHLANIYFEDNNYLLAMKHYKKTIALDTKNSDAQLGLGKCYSQTKRYDLALRPFAYHCFLSKMVSVEFRGAIGHVRRQPKLHKKYEAWLTSCKLRKP